VLDWGERGGRIHNLQPYALCLIGLTALNSIRPPSSAPIKRVLVILYSQTGQLTRIVDSILEPLRQDSGIDVHVEHLRPVTPFPFPWTFFSFLDVFPESAHLVPPQMHSLALTGDEDFDLVILPYQVWFLAPSQPMTGFLKGALAKKLLAGKPVVTVIGCRNMWLLAQEKMKDLLKACGARLIDNVALTDPSPTMVTLLTTPVWLLTGKRDLLSALPPAGVDDASVVAARRFGLALCDALHSDAERGAAPLLAGLAAVDVDARLLFSEKMATRSFAVWGKLLRAVGEPGQARRRPLLLLYVIFLVAIILTIVPVSLVVQALLRPFLLGRFAALKRVYEAPSGSGRERMALYGR